MKDKILFLGSICLILALGLVIAGCKNEVQSIELGSVSAPKNVTAAWVAEVKDNPATTVNEYKAAHILVTWDAVADAGDYGIVYTLDGSKNYQWLASGSDSIKKTTSTKSTTQDTDGNYTYTITTTLDIDKAEAEIFKPEWDNSYGSNKLIEYYGGLALKIGVLSYSRNGDGKYQSKPAWAKDLVSIPNTYKE
jgi:hypothetical protein